MALSGSRPRSVPCRLRALTLLGPPAEAPATHTVAWTSVSVGIAAGLAPEEVQTCQSAAARPVLGSSPPGWFGPLQAVRKRWGRLPPGALGGQPGQASPGCAAPSPAPRLPPQQPSLPEQPGV